MQAQAVRMVADDGYYLAGRLYELPDGHAQIAVLLAPAIGMEQGRYQAYAAFLAAQGFSVLTFDYRGIGASQMGEWTGAAPSVADWCERDLPAAIDYLVQARPHYSRVAVAHSFGGQALGWAWNNDQLRGILGLSTPSLYWRHWPWWQRPLLQAFWRLGVPAVSALRGRFPGERMGMADLPATLANSWARWALQDPLKVHQHFAAFTGRLRLYCIADDRRLGACEAVRALGQCFTSAGVELVHVKATDWGMARIGHFGFFSRHAPAAVWQESADWLYAVGHVEQPRQIEV